MGCFTKAALFIVNFAIFAAGVAVVALASVILNKDSSYGSLLKDGVFTLPIIILIAGLIVVVIGFLGCCGAVKGSSCMLKTYAFIIIVMLLAEIILGILLLVYPKQAEDYIKGGMKDFFEKYSIDDTAAKSIDAIQSDLHCCGVESYKDWAEFTYGEGEEKNVSRGCCLEDVVSNDCFVGKNDLPEAEAKEYIYTEGCYYAVKKDLEGVTVGLGVVLFIMAIVQVLAVTCACGLAKKSGSTHYA